MTRHPGQSSDSRGRLSKLLVILAGAIDLVGIAGCGGGPGTTPPPPPPCLAEQVTGGVSATWVLKANGDVWGYGSGQGQPSHGKVDGLPASTVRIALRSDMVCVLSAAQELRCEEVRPTDTTTPVANVVQIKMGVAFDPGGVTSAARNFAIKTDGSLWAVARTQDPSEVVPETALGNDVATASAGWDQRCAVKIDGSLWCWGAGFLGDGMVEYPSTDQQPPRQIPLSAAAVDVVAAANYTCAQLEDGDVWCWGNRAFGSADRQTYPPYLSPVRVDISDVKSLAAGAWHFCALKNEGSLWCWGDNRYGQSGFEPGGYAYSDTWETPRQVVALGNDVTQVAAGDIHTCARKSDGTIWCWGNSSKGQVGNLNYVNATPVEMLGCD